MGSHTKFGVPVPLQAATCRNVFLVSCLWWGFVPSIQKQQADIIDAINTTSRYLDDILNINNVYFGNMVSQIYPSGLQLNKTDTEAAF